MIIYLSKRKIDLGAVKKLGFFGKFLGLMFRSKESGSLLFSFRRDVSLPIHSFFVFFPFIAIWTDDKYKISESRVVYPFSLSVLPREKFRHLIEIPYTEVAKRKFVFLVGKGKI